MNSVPVDTMRARAVLVVALVLFAVVGLLAIAVAAGWSLPASLDLAVEPMVHDWVLAHPNVVVAADVVTALGSPVAMDVLAAVAAVAAWVVRRRTVAVAVVAVRVVELIIETGLKAAVDRPRPTFDPPLATATSSSFPSGHSAGTAAVVVIVVMALLGIGTSSPEWWRWSGRLVTLVGTVFVLAVGASRVVLGVHYPSDVLAGVCLGVACALAAEAGVRRWCTGRSGSPATRQSEHVE